MDADSDRRGSAEKSAYIAYADPDEEWPYPGSKLTGFASQHGIGTMEIFDFNHILIGSREAMSDTVTYIQAPISGIARSLGEKGRRISLREARQLALKAMEMADKLRREDREREIAYFENLDAV